MSTTNVALVQRVRDLCNAACAPTTEAAVARVAECVALCALIDDAEHIIAAMSYIADLPVDAVNDHINRILPSDFVNRFPAKDATAQQWMLFCAAAATFTARARDNTEIDIEFRDQVVAAYKHVDDRTERLVVWAREFSRVKSACQLEAFVAARDADLLDAVIKSYTTTWVNYAMTKVMGAVMDSLFDIRKRKREDSDDGIRAPSPCAACRSSPPVRPCTVQSVAEPPAAEPPAAEPPAQPALPV